MRRDIVHVGAASLKYEIREIVSIAHEVERLGQAITWENIGDPVQKGETPPQWIREIVSDLVHQRTTWAYCDSAGVGETREFLADNVNTRRGVQVTTDDIMFFNGLGDAVAKVYGFLRREARILGPSPAYSTHSSAEAAHSGYNHVTYNLDPTQGWMPDVDDIRNKVKYNDSIAGILILTPDNPTGAVYPRAILEEIAEIAREYDLFIITDEIYAHIVYNGQPRLHLSEWIGDVPGIAMRGISKEYPWPGSRCGWLEILNKDKDDNFAAYVDSLLAAKRLEVSSTTLPQMSIPLVMGDPRYADHLDGREAMFSARADEMMAVFDGCESVLVNKPCGAFYYTVMLNEGLLNHGQSLPIANPRIAELIAGRVQDVAPDKRFVHYLMGATGIVVVPLTGFQCAHEGFRATLLETDDVKRAWTLKTLRESIEAYP
ncbi:MAG: aminotransferase [Acidobacteria bacterium]|jgi:aspartate/methionine/tyrosine aminotransferase|nr:aminotransferase [Acidobacteriota bacterium]HJN46094.1 pyridoxal phosphate-dependent aminotransferase [Vicinamibacterales bacterium]|tara:strand:+ start:4769 stop:6061 length:1293 start_codon:yes stop_codon:yes gene_type:complete